MATFRRLAVCDDGSEARLDGRRDDEAFTEVDDGLAAGQRAERIHQREQRVDRGMALHLQQQVVVALVHPLAAATAADRRLPRPGPSPADAGVVAAAFGLPADWAPATAGPGELMPALPRGSSLSICDVAACAALLDRGLQLLRVVRVRRQRAQRLVHDEHARQFIGLPALEKCLGGLVGQASAFRRQPVVGKRSDRGRRPRQASPAPPRSSSSCRRSWRCRPPCGARS